MHAAHKAHVVPPDRLDQMVQRASEDQRAHEALQVQPVLEDLRALVVQLERQDHAAPRDPKDPLGLQTGPLKPPVQAARRAYTMDCALKMVGERVLARTLQRVTV